MATPQPNVPLMLWGATIAGVIFIVVVAVVFVPVQDGMPAEDIDWLLYVGLFMTLPAFVMIQRQRSRTEDAIRMRQADQQALQQDLARQLISYALAEAPAFFGIVYYMLSGDKQGLFLLAGVSLLLLLWARPRRR